MTSDAPVEATETAPAESTSTQVAGETADNGTQVQSEGPTFDGSQLDLSDVPEDMRSKVIEYGEREFKKYLTRTTQDHSAETKQVRLQYDETKKQLDELTHMARDVLTNPDRLEYYRQQAGVSQAQPEEKPQLNTVEDLYNALQNQDDKMADFENRFTERVNAVSTAQIKKYDNNQRYQNAVSRLSGEDSTFAQFQKETIGFMTSQPDFKQKYGYSGGNEYEALKAAYNDYYSSKLSKFVESNKQQQMDSMKLKKQSSTMIPQKSVEPTSQGTKNKDQMIASIVARLGKAGPL